MRLGIGIGHPGHRDDVVGYVVRNDSREDRVLIDQAMDDAIRALPDILAGQTEKAMQALHTAK
mgnify:CR=1 FL=1